MLINTKKENISLPFFIDQDDDGVRVAESPLFDGCMTQGYSLDELQANIEDVSGLYFDMLHDGEDVLRGNRLVFVSFDAHAKITNSISSQITQYSREALIPRT